jgi:hypothetical protein
LVVHPRHPAREFGITATTDLQEVDRDELGNVQGGTYGDDDPRCGFHPPGAPSRARELNTADR